MSKRKPFLIRLPPAIHQALQKWSEDELRSLNSHVEFLLRQALQKAGRLPRPGDIDESED